MKLGYLVLSSLALCSCSTTKDSGSYGFFLHPGMDEDAQDRNNTKYNLMDSSDGMKDPTANLKIWGTKY